MEKALESCGFSKKMGGALKPSRGLIIPIADVRNGTIETGTDEVGMAGL
jgi:hypothetical protein